MSSPRPHDDRFHDLLRRLNAGEDTFRIPDLTDDASITKLIFDEPIVDGTITGGVVASGVMRDSVLRNAVITNATVQDARVRTGSVWTVGRIQSIVPAPVDTRSATDDGLVADEDIEPLSLDDVSDKAPSPSVDGFDDATARELEKWINEAEGRMGRRRNPDGFRGYHRALSPIYEVDGYATDDSHPNGDEEPALHAVHDETTTTDGAIASVVDSAETPCCDLILTPPSTVHSPEKPKPAPMTPTDILALESRALGLILHHEAVAPLDIGRVQGGNSREEWSPERVPLEDRKDWEKMATERLDHLVTNGVLEVPDHLEWKVDAHRLLPILVPSVTKEEPTFGHSLFSPRLRVDRQKARSMDGTS